jgi:peptide-methionine (R)-S-oxide reductase
MITRRHFLTALTGTASALVFSRLASFADELPTTTPKTGPIAKITHTDAEWRKLLTPEQYHILREHGTEPPFSGKYVDNHEKGIYLCAGCDLELFSSETKFESGTGWPSFYAPIAKDHIKVNQDNSLGMSRDELSCARCDGHLGHVFPDGPPPTGLRYCIDSLSLKFKKA